MTIVLGGLSEGFLAFHFVLPVCETEPEAPHLQYYLACVTR